MGFILTDIEKEYKRRQKLINLYRKMDYKGYYFGLTKSRKTKTIIFPGIVKKLNPDDRRFLYIQPLFGEPKSQYDLESEKNLCFTYNLSTTYYKSVHDFPEVGDIVEVYSVWYKRDDLNYKEDQNIVFTNYDIIYPGDYYCVTCWQVGDIIIKNQKENFLKDYSLDKLRDEYLSKGGDIKDLEEPPEKVQVQKKVTRSRIYYTWEGVVELVFRDYTNWNAKTYAIKPIPGTSARKQYDLYLKHNNFEDESYYLRHYWKFEPQISLKRKCTISKGDHVIVKLLTNKYIRSLNENYIYYSNMLDHLGLITNSWYISEKK